MANPYFEFKQFTIWHDKCAMKVGTDGVLLGVWAEVPVSVSGAAVSGTATNRILDVGTGSGLVALMLAQRFPCVVDGIEIDEDAVTQARENVSNSPFSERVNIFNVDFADKNELKNRAEISSKYDLIVSNPPFYTEDTVSGDVKRDSARHTHSLSFDALIKNASELLNDEGLFTVIIPTVAVSDFVSISVQNALYLKRMLDIKTTEKKSPKRTMLEFSRQILQSETRVLCLRDQNNEWSKEYKELTKDFYL